MRPALPSAVLAALALAAVAGSARAGSPFFVLQDDGTIATNAFTTDAEETTVANKVLALYDAAGGTLPEIMSVWTTFPLGGDVYNTVFDPLANDVTGIGLQQEYGGDGTFPSCTPPLQSILFHNDVLVLPARAAMQGAPVDGFGTYLFLLEMSHNWGPELEDPGATPTELVGFPFHWSFWMDAGGSPAGGNQWKDNGDGTFSTLLETPAGLAYSMIDLYIMGLAAANEVSPFGVLENPVPPAGLMDPLWGGAYAAHSFPWFGATPMTVTATRKQITIADIVTANGARVPAAGQSPTSWTIAEVLIVSSTDTAADIAAAEQTFAPIAATFVPAFHTATGNRGTLELITPPLPDGGAGGAGGEGGQGGGHGGAGGGTTKADGGLSGTSSMSSSSSVGGTSQGGKPASGGCGCRAATEEPGPSGWAAGLLAALAAWRRRRPAGLLEGSTVPSPGA
jgi:MYXO-CTERM domain-containing protein